MGEWKTYRLGEICDVRDGTHDSPKQSLTGKPLVTSKNIKGGIINLSSTYLISNEDYQSINKRSCVHQWDILFSMIGTVGELAIVKNEPQFAIKNIGLFKMNGDQLLSYWIYYYLHSDNAQENILKNIKGSTQQYIALKDLRLLPIGLPPIEIKQRIVEILKSLDDKIELNRRINANLEAQAQALFRSWFVDFEPFRDGPFVDSELGKIPQGWKVGTINEIIQILSGYAFKSDTFTEAGPYRLITIKNVQDGSLNIDGAAYLSDIPDKMPQHCHLAIGDILLSLTGNVGRVCIVDRDGLLLNQRVAKLQPKDKQNTFFTYALFRQDSFKQYLIQIAKGTAQLNLSPVETSDTKIVLPNQDVLLQFGEIGQPLFDNIVSNCKEIITLSALRDTLLPKLMAGEIKI